MSKPAQKEPGADRLNHSRKPAVYERLKFEAAVLYIKRGLSACQVCEQLKISLPTMGKWRKAGRWDELRPDLETINLYKAAGMYIEKGFTASEISERLSIEKWVINMWIDMHGWDGARLISQSENIHADILTDFKRFFTDYFPAYATEIEVAQTAYLKQIKPKIW